jgi:septum formation protein
MRIYIIGTFWSARTRYDIGGSKPTISRGKSVYRAKEAIILASHSPRRREFLKSLGIRFEVMGADIDESVLPDEPVTDHVARLARNKAVAVARTRTDAFVLGADTLVAVGDTVLGKPVDENDARRMLGLLSGKAHRVLTGWCLVRPKGAGEISGVAETTVIMRQLSPPEIEAYVATGEPLDKAGAYAVQGFAAAFVRRIEGSYTNVVGLPVAEVVDALLSSGAVSVVS